MDIKRIIREYYEQYYANQFNNLDETDKFLKKCKLPKLTQEKIDNMSSSMSTKVIEFVDKNLPTK